MVVSYGLRNWLEQPHYWKKRSHGSCEFFPGNRAAQAALCDITGDSTDEISPTYNRWLLGWLGWMLLLLYALTPAPIWPTQSTLDTGRNPRPLYQWGDAMPPISMEELVTYKPSTWFSPPSCHQVPSLLSYTHSKDLHYLPTYLWYLSTYICRYKGRVQCFFFFFFFII